MLGAAPMHCVVLAWACSVVAVNAEALVTACSMG